MAIELLQQCPNIFLFNLHNMSTGLRRKQANGQPVQVRVQCQRCKGHKVKCLVRNPNDGMNYEIEGVTEIIPEQLFVKG